MSVDDKCFFQNGIMQVMLEWCQTVCAFYDVPVDNFTVSFSDGRVLCLLLHHYHPTLLPLDRIHMTTSVSHQQNEFNASWDYLASSEAVDLDQLRDNEKENFKVSW